MLKFKTVTDKEECRSLWEKYTKKQIIWDLWDFRFCFHNSNFSFNFVLGLDGERELGILPLVFDKINKVYTYFGDTFPEQNKFLLEDKSNIKHFLEKCPKNTQIYYIDSEESKYYKFAEGDKRYFLNLEKYNCSFENYLKSFKKKHRKNLNYDLRKLKEKGYSISYNKLDDFKSFVGLNKKRFGEESDYNDETFVEGIYRAISTAFKMGILDIVSIEIGNRAEAVGLGVFYNGVYCVFGIGRNVEIKNLGKLLIAEQIKSAIEHKCKEIDFFSTESNWKELW
ncbi:GNAT family N-acetyltransferase, partial [Candidatus Woesearchaeota archaeon]|nr:GNAT family N-acetyltransferase [Candidatus Woesearchaeota archaeon]